MLSQLYLISTFLPLCFLLIQSATPPARGPATSAPSATSNNRAAVNLTTAQAVQRQVHQMLSANGTETKPTFFFTNVGPNSFEYRGMFSPGKAPSLDFQKSFADFFDNFPKFPNFQFHTHTVINHRNDQQTQKPSPPTPPPITVPVTYTPRITIPVIPTVPPVPEVRIQQAPPVKPRRVQKIRPFTRIKPTPPPVSYQQNPARESPPNAIPVSYFPQPPKPPQPPVNHFLYQPQPVQHFQPQPFQPQPVQPFQPILYQNQLPQIPTPAPPPNTLTHIIEQQPPFDLYRLTIPGSNNPIIGNNGLNGINNPGLSGIGNPYQNQFINPLPRIDSPNTIQQHNPQGGPEDGNNPFQFPFAFPEYHIVRGQDRAESYPKIFRFEDGRTNIVEFERNKKRFRKRKGDRISGPVNQNGDPLSPDRVGRDKFLILHGGFFRHNNEVSKVSQRYTERFTSFYYDSNELQDNAESKRTTVTDTEGTTAEGSNDTKTTKATDISKVTETVRATKSTGSPRSTEALAVTKESGRSRSKTVGTTRTTKALGRTRTTKANVATRTTLSAKTTPPETTVTPKPAKPKGYGYRI